VDKKALLSAADVVRADAREAELLTGTAIRGPEDAARAAAAILGQGPALAALAVGDAGNYFAWRDPDWGTGELLLPLARTPVADTTGAGDAFTAALITGLDQLQQPEEAAHLAVAAAGLPFVADDAAGLVMDAVRRDEVGPGRSWPAQTTGRQRGAGIRPALYRLV
jgi:ribokinase